MRKGKNGRIIDTAWLRCPRTRSNGWKTTDIRTNGHSLKCMAWLYWRRKTVKMVVICCDRWDAKQPSKWLLLSDRLLKSCPNRPLIKYLDWWKWRFKTCTDDLLIIALNDIHKLMFIFLFTFFLVHHISNFGAKAWNPREQALSAYSPPQILAFSRVADLSLVKSTSSQYFQCCSNIRISCMKI